MSNIITDFYCNGYFGRRYDLDRSIIIIDESNYTITIKTENNEILTACFNIPKHKEEMNNIWTKQ